MPDIDRSWIPSFAATIIVMMAIQMSSLGFSPLLPAIQKDFELTYSQIGLFTALYGLVAMAVRVPAGILAKRIGEKLALSAGLLGVALGLLLLSQASSYQGAVGARVVWLIGYQTAFVCVMTSIALVAVPRRNASTCSAGSISRISIPIAGASRRKLRSSSGRRCKPRC